MPVRNPPLQEEEDQRNRHDNHAQRGGEIAVVGHLSHELVIQHHREGAVALADQHGRAEIGEHAHKHQQGRGQHRRQHQRQDDARNALEVVGAQAFGRLVQGVIQVLQRAADIHVHQREGLEREHQHNARKAVYAAKRHAEDRVDPLGKQAVAPQQLNPRIRTDERRGQVANHNADVQRFAARNAVLARDVGNHKAQRRADQRGYNSHLEGVQQRIGVVLAGKEAGKVGQREAVIGGVDHALVHDQHQRVHHKDQEDRQHQQRQEGPDRGMLLFHRLTPLRGSACCAFPY